MFAKSTNPIFYEGNENMHNKIIKLSLKIKNAKEITKYIYKKKRGFLFITNINDFLKKTSQRTLTTIL